MQVLRIFLMVAAAVFVLRWLRKQMGSGGQSAARREPIWPGTRSTGAFERSKLKVLQFRSDPLEVLGLAPGASQEEIDAAYAAAMTENDANKVADMGDEIRELAARRQREIERAYRQLCGEE